MAGERLSKITIQASFSINPKIRGEQAKEVRFKLGGQWAVFRLGAYPDKYEFALPDADSADLHAYMLDGITNLIAVIRAYIKDKSLPYVVSDVRYIGDNPANPEQPLVQFDIQASTYFQVNDLDFYSVSPTGWGVIALVNTIQPVIVTYDKTDATIYDSATGSISIHASNGTLGSYTYTWDDLKTPFGGPAERTDLKAGKYRVRVLDGSGASTTVVIIIGSDSKLEVAVSATQDSIELKASGGRPGYNFQWKDGPTGPVRINLTDGTYECHVTDSIGAICDVVVTLTPYRYYWSRNAITLELDAGQDYRDDPSTKPNLSFLCEVWLEKEYLTGEFEQIGVTIEQPADRNGRTTFEVQELLNVYLQYHVPAPAATDVERADPLFRRFFLKHAQQFGEVPAPAPSATLDRSYVVLGGLNFYEAQARTWFTSYQPEKKPFLTWEPATKWVLADQPEYLYYMAQDSSAFRTQVLVHFSDGSKSLVAYTGSDEVSKFEVYCLPVGYQALSLAKLNSASKQVVSWEVFVATSDGNTVLSETRHFYLHTRQYPRRRYLLFATSLGGMATYAALGEAQTDLEMTGAESAITLQPSYDPLLGDTVVQERTMRPVVKIAGGKRTRVQLEVSKDLLLSRRVLLFDATRWLPGYIKTKTGNLLDESKLVLTQEFDFYLTTERLYTPSL